MLEALSRELCGTSLPPLSGNIYCVGRNYAAHAKELQNEIPQEPVIFLKAPAALRAWHSGPLAFAEEQFHHEVELVLLIGNHIDRNGEARLEDITAMSLGIDLTRRGVQSELKVKGLPWGIAKSFAGAGILSPFSPVNNHILTTNIGFELLVNNELRQSGETRNMIFGFTAMLRYLLIHQDLYPGDIVFTGTPQGVGGLHKGDRIHGRSRQLGIDIKGVL